MRRVHWFLCFWPFWVNLNIFPCRFSSTTRLWFFPVWFQHHLFSFSSSRECPALGWQFFSSIFPSYGGTTGTPTCEPSSFPAFLCASFFFFSHNHSSFDFQVFQLDFQFPGFSVTFPSCRNPCQGVDFRKAWLLCDPVRTPPQSDLKLGDKHLGLLERGSEFQFKAWALCFRLVNLFRASSQFHYDVFQS